MKIKTISKFVCIGLATLCTTACMAAEEVLFQTDFNNTADPLPGWGRNSAANVVKEGADGSFCLKFDLPIGGAAKDAMISIPLDVAKFRGKSIVIEAMMKGKDITKSKADYLGPKLMLHYKSPAGDMWPDQEKKIGTYDWQKFTVTQTIPADVQKMDLTLGMQDCQGTLWINNVKISVSQDK